MQQANEVIDFWRTAGQDKWFRGGKAFDAECRDRFASLHHAAARREHDGWMESADGALALVLLLDQISRNIFRGSGHAFATDSLALHHADRALVAGFDRGRGDGLGFFFYMPFEHSEAMADQERAVALFRANGTQAHLDYALAHRDAIGRFGRFPHRNHALGRTSTPDEQTYLDAGGGF